MALKKPNPQDEAVADHGLSGFDPINLLQRAVAIQLRPENAQRLLRLEYLAGVAASIQQSSGKPAISSGRLRRVIESGLGVSHLEDPVTWPLVESIAFFEGDYLIMPGLTEQLRPGLDHLLTAALLHPELKSEIAFRRSISQPCQALLHLSNAMCQRAGLSRGTAPGGGSQLLIPAGADSERTIHAITWTDQELAGLFADTNTNAAALRPFESVLGLPAPYGRMPHQWGLVSTPLIRDGNRILVAGPHLLPTALSQFVLTCAYSHDLLARLSQAVHDTTLLSVNRCLNLMGLPLLAEKYQPVSSIKLMHQEFRRLDYDKILHVIILADDFTSYAPDDPNTLGQFPTASVIENALESGATMAKATSTSITEVMELIVLGGGIRYGGIALEDDKSSQRRVLALTIQDLQTISYLERNNPLYIWHFAKARDRLRAKTEVRTTSIMDELNWYRSKDSSFYMSDDALPNMLMLQPNEGGVLLQESQRHFAPHAIRTISGGYQECVRVYPESGIPTFTPRIPDPNVPAQCVELPEGEIWITANIDALEAGSTARDMALTIIDAAAFWLARASPSALVREAAQRRAHIKIVIERPEEWDSFKVNTPADAAVRLPRAEQLDARQLIVYFPPESMQLIPRTDVSADRMLLAPLFHALALAAGEDSAAADAALTSIMPTRWHRRLQGFSVEETPAAIQRPLPSAHLVPSAAEHEVLDLVEGIFDTEGVGEGEVPTDRRTAVINTVVKGLYALLCEAIAKLDPHGLLEWLIAHNEAVIDALARARLSEPYNVACFGEDAGSAKEFANRLTDLSKTDLACRFLIELVAAQPPLGTASMSNGTYDQLLSLASKIVSFGMLSDDIQYKSDDPKISRLPSGRIGIGESVRQQERDRFLQSHGGSVRARLMREAIVHEPDWIQQKRAKAIGAVKSASISEFGMSLDQHMELITVAVDICVEQKKAAAVISKADFVKRASLEMNVHQDTASAWIDSLSLAPRVDFFRVPAPADRTDVYPWRFNRRWSLLRRPFVIRGTDVLFGSSQLVRAAENLAGLCHTGRLKATPGGKMAEALGAMIEIAGYHFNATIAEMFRRRPDLIVGERAERFGQLRIQSDSGKELGDIDVLVIDPRHKRIRAYECKDLSLARVPSEIANEMAALIKGDRSIVAKHGKRVAWLQQHYKEVLQHFGVSDKGKWSIGAAIIVDDELVSSFLVKVPMPVVTIAELERILASGSGIP